MGCPATSASRSENGKETSSPSHPLEGKIAWEMSVVHWRATGFLVSVLTAHTVISHVICLFKFIPICSYESYANAKRTTTKRNLAHRKIKPNKDSSCVIMQPIIDFTARNVDILPPLFLFIYSNLFLRPLLRHNRCGKFYHTKKWFSFMGSSWKRERIDADIFFFIAESKCKH